MQLLQLNKLYKKKQVLFTCFALLFLTKISIAQNNTSQIFILPGAKYLTNFGNEIDNIKLAGNARFMHDSVYMSCDTAYIYNKTQAVDAIGNVRINQGDSLFLYGDTLKYYGQTKMAYVYGNVKLIENDLTLYCDSAVYDLNTNVAKYTTGGKVISKKNKNTLTSTSGYYFSDYKKISFKDSVTLTNPDYTMKSDTLDYFENTETAYFFGNTTITGKDNFIFCKNGWYNTATDIAQFSKDAYLIADKHTLAGDSLYYDRNLGYGKAIKNVKITDTANAIIVDGQFAEHYEKKNISVVTGNPLVSKWFDADTLFLTADTIRVYNDSNNDKNIMYAHHKVAFHKSDIQGVCDSMIYLQNDSMLSMFYDPIVWSDQSQLTGDTILVGIANNKLNRIDLRQNSFIIEQVKTIGVKDDTTFIDDSINNKIDTVLVSIADTILTDYFNQIKGKNVKGIFKNDSIRKVYVNGNGQSIYYTGDEGKPIQALNKILCSDIVMTFKSNKVDDILFLRKPEGALIPLEKISVTDQKLDQFEWKNNMRPTGKSNLIQEKK